MPSLSPLQPSLSPPPPSCTHPISLSNLSSYKKRLLGVFLIANRHLPGYTQISQAVFTGGTHMLPGKPGVCPASSSASTSAPHALLSFLVPAAARLPPAMSQTSPAQPKMAWLNGTGDFRAQCPAPRQSGLGQCPGLPTLPRQEPTPREQCLAGTEGKVPTCGLPPAVPPQPSLGRASCSSCKPATCACHLGPGLGGEPLAHVPALGAVPL